MVLFVQVCCGRGLAAKAWLEGVCPQENAEVGPAVNMLGREC